MDEIEINTLDDLLRHQTNIAAERPAILFEDQTLSYGEFYDDVGKAARMLLGLGMNKGDRLALMFSNRPEMLVLYFACFRIGVIVVPINTRYQRSEIKYALAHSGCCMLIADKTFAAMVEGLDQIVSSLARILIRHHESEQHENALHVHLANAPTVSEWPEVLPDDPAVIFYTSGSTSRPKGVTHTHFSLLGNARIQVPTREIRQDTVWLVSTGVGYVAGLAGVTAPAFLAGCTLVLVPVLQADHLLRAIERHRVEITLLLPTMMLEMLESPLSAKTDLASLKACFVAGDVCSQDLYRRYRERTGQDLLQAFGMTECEGFLSNRPSGPNQIGTVGKPAKGITLRLVDAEGQDVASGQSGEILVKGDSVMVGYWDDPENTREALCDGWLRSGDIATCDTDGFYTFHERHHEVIIRGGSNVSPHEVENIIDSYAGVQESCVVGVPDAHYGAMLVAYIEWEQAALPVNIDGLKAWVSEHLAAYKVPDRWNIVEQLPKTATGKIDRKLLHQRAEADKFSLKN